MTLSTRRLGATSVSVTTLGFGCAPIGGLLGAVDERPARHALDTAWEGGVRYFDTAPFYGFGASERRVGDALREHPRDDYVLSTKAGRLLRPHADPPGAENGWEQPLPFRPVYDYGYDAVRRSLEDSLQRLGLERIDVLLLHDIGRFTHAEAAHAHHFEAATTGGLKALMEMKREGLIGAYGIGVNETAVLMAALERGEWDCFLLAGRYTLLEQDALDDLLTLCVSRGTSIICGGPYNSGLLAGGATWNYAEAPADLIARRDRLAAICNDHGVSLRAAALQFPLAHPAVASVIPGARTPDEARDNLARLAEPLPADLWRELQHENLLRPDAPIPSA
ncbi:aldo/keto reductase [Tranquillimonas alkanivorans]|uniref:D-threo-aldose 1-dehydrogenase n=1 Tax=Tranquillimonas alkanivorans TaxID=441119 RepID=A0A1I5VJW5_9RHOB|nr:aldo/keto reductase [Tranquillimonas alkanivorans]SFQ07770.1 D-threo-aldose 1-dehydrogenase [Tranquillimonas alkanivorans]